MSDDELDSCDTCGEPLGATGLMAPTGEKLRLDEGGPELPVYRFYCSRVCVRNDPGGY